MEEPWFEWVDDNDDEGTNNFFMEFVHSFTSGYLFVCCHLEFNEDIHKSISEINHRWLVSLPVHVQSFLYTVNLPNKKITFYLNVAHWRLKKDR